MVAGNQHRIYICLNAILCISRYAQKFNGAPHFFRVANICSGDFRDALYGNIPENYPGMKRHGAKIATLRPASNPSMSAVGLPLHTLVS